MKDKEQKLTGSYYTPPNALKFMWDYLDAKKKYKRILEPSVGDGRFLEHILVHNTHDVILDAIEIDTQKAKRLKTKYCHKNQVQIINQDFLEYANSNKNPYYDLIIGNPPYINKKNMPRKSIDLLYSLADGFNLNGSICQNLWVGFILGAARLLICNGAIFFVLPLEFLQVNYAESLRNWLESKFNTIHVITFEKRMFPEIEQETCLVYMTNLSHKKPAILYRKYIEIDIDSLDWESSIVKNKPLKKWANAVLNDREIELLTQPNNNLINIGTLGHCAPGVVTAANRELILSKKECDQLKASNFVRPIISKSSYLRNEIVITDDIITRLDHQEKKDYLLDLKGETGDLPKELMQYLDEVGNKIRHGRKIKESYKCSRRTPWYGVPLTRVGDICFFKRYDKFPRLCLNESGALTTDIAYNLLIQKRYDPKSIVFSFYNSFTLALCEFNCRYYGGGVAELTPSEFKSIRIPYVKVNDRQWSHFVDLIKAGTPILQIAEYVDSIALKDWSHDELQTTKSVFKKLILRRGVSLQS